MEDDPMANILISPGKYVQGAFARYYLGGLSGV